MPRRSSEIISAAELGTNLIEIDMSMGKRRLYNWVEDHNWRTMMIAERMSHLFKLTPEETKVLINAALRHDDGKYWIPARILTKKEELTKEEWRIIKWHPTLGAEWALVKGESEEVATLVWQHHEKLNGTGYPRGISGREIHDLAPILSLADIVDSLRSTRPYRSVGYTGNEIVKILQGISGRTVKKEYVDTLIAHFSEFEIRSSGNGHNKEIKD